MHRKLWRCAKMHIWALTYFEEVGHITECCYFDAMNFFWSDYCSPKWELEVQHSGHMWVQCLPMGTKWQCMPMGMKVQHSGHMSAMRLKFLNVSTFKSAQVPWTYFCNTGKIFWLYLLMEKTCFFCIFQKFFACFAWHKFEHLKLLSYLPFSPVHLLF